MTFPKRLRGNRSWLLLLIGALILSVGPARLVDAREQIKDLDNASLDFVGGKFQRASANNYVSSSDGTDVKGAVQLSAVGTLKFSGQVASASLPVKLQSAGATVIKDHMYVIGGIGPNGSVSTVYSARVDLDTGDLPDGWVTEPALNAQQSSNSTSFSTAVAPVNSEGVVSASFNGTNYIYVIGGSATIGANSFSSYAVRYAPVAATGHIVDSTSSTTDGWQPLPGGNIPQTDATDQSSQLGLIAPNVTTFTNPDTGVTYIYIIGGLQSVLTGSGGNTKVVNAGSLSIFAARVGTAGVLFKANTADDSTANRGWQLLDQEIPIAASDIPDANADARNYRGLWNGVAVADRFTASTDPAHTDAIFVMGGQLAPAVGSAQATYSNKVFEFYIGANGQLTASTNSAVMPDARHGHSGFEFRGNIYLTGGLPNVSNDPDKTVLTSYVTGTLALNRFGPVGSPNFLTNPSGLPITRAFHSTVVVQNNAGAGFVYVIGGRGSSNENPTTDDNGSDTIYYSQLNKDEDQTAGYAPDGWYYSRTFSLNNSAVNVREIKWLTYLATPASMNIGTQFRVSSDNDCALLQTANTAVWQPLDSGAGNDRSVDGANVVEKTGVVGRCFQYRAHMSTSVTATPMLLKFSVKIVIPGSADLKVNKINQNKQDTATTGISVGIINRNDTLPANQNPTLAADLDNPGSFYVDLFIFEGSVPITPTLPLNGSQEQYHRGCAQVPNSAMTATAVYTITQWYSASDDTCKSVPLSVTTMFPKTGTTYSVLVAVDTDCAGNTINGKFYGCVNELDATNGEDNNISWVKMDIADIKVIAVDNSIALPLVSRRP